MDAARDITASVVRALLRYVERALGLTAVPELIAAAGLDPGDERFLAEVAWFSTEELHALADAALEATGDLGIGRRLGEEFFQYDLDIGTTDFLRAEEDPGAAVALAVSETARMVTVRRYEVVERHRDRIVVDAIPLRDGTGHRVQCDMLAGYWALIPTLFDAPGAAVHERCAALGDDRCRLLVRWGDPVLPTDQELARSQRRASTLVRRFEELQRLAVDLALVDDLDEAMRCIVDRAGSAMLARRFLLTIREHPDAQPRAFGSDLPDGVPQEVAALLWAHDGAAEGLADAAHLGLPVVVDVASGGRHRGYLVAFLPEGASVRAIDERLLSAYARHAAATIDRIVSAAVAQREHRTVSALLRLAHALAGARSVAEVTDLVTEAVGDVTGCAVSGVWLLDASRRRYQLQVVREDGAHDGPRILDVADPESIVRLTHDPAPFVLRKGDAPAIDPVLAGWGVEEAYVAPIVHREHLFGLLATAGRTSLDQREHASVLATVSALAHHAATAIANTELLAEIRHQATHDSLTGLPNRPQIEARALEALRDAGERGTTVALAFVDLDRFKIVNDTLGHVAGDDLIGRVADRLEEHLRPSDVVARLGGDEFLVLLTDLNGPGQAEEVAGRLLDSLRAPISIRGETLFVTASIGIACYPDHGRDYGVLFRRADAAMYVAKGKGRNRIALHRAPADGHRSRLKLESQLRHAVERDELRVLYQPQIDLITDEIVAAEALVRWQHPTLGLVGPGTFLGIAEDTGVIVDIDRWVRRAALTQGAAWFRSGLPLRVAVNVSRHDLADAGLAGELQDVLAELGLPPELVELEITDRIVMSDEDLPPSLADLRALGIRLAVDDFGTGSSVLSRLQHCPVDVLKVDRTFVEPLSRPRPDTRLVDALVSMAHALGMEVVIEGVEDEEQAHAVRLLGAESAQGWYFHRPMPAEELTPLLELHARSGPPVTAARFGLARRRSRGVRR